MKSLDRVIFDLDSTLVTIEGLDWLAKEKGIEREVSVLTHQSMEGVLPVELAFEKKMALLAPSYMELVKLGNFYIKNLVENAKETIDILHAFKKNVWIVTGNFNPGPQTVAEYLGIPLTQVKSNTAFFDNKKQYAGYDKNNPLIKNGGKKEIVKKYIKKNNISTVFIGDAITDLETKEVVDLFIGFGGVVRRDIVEKNAEIYITDKDISSILKFILNNNEIEENYH